MLRSFQGKDKKRNFKKRKRGENATPSLLLANEATQRYDACVERERHFASAQRTNRIGQNAVRISKNQGPN
jgi:hypothetical protein